MVIFGLVGSGSWKRKTSIFSLTSRSGTPFLTSYVRGAMNGGNVYALARISPALRRIARGQLGQQPRGPARQRNVSVPLPQHRPPPLWAFLERSSNRRSMPPPGVADVSSKALGYCSQS